jgi:hypothetical protein
MLSAMVRGGDKLNFTTDPEIRHILEPLLTKTKVENGCKKKKGTREKAMKEIISR